MALPQLAQRNQHGMWNVFEQLADASAQNDVKINLNMESWFQLTDITTFRSVAVTVSNQPEGALQFTRHASEILSVCWSTMFRARNVVLQN